MMRCRYITPRTFVSPVCKTIKHASWKRHSTTTQTATHQLLNASKPHLNVESPMNKDSVYDMHAIETQIKKHKKELQYRDAIFKFESFKERRPNTFSYDLWLNALDCYAKTGQLSKMMTMYRELTRGRHATRVYNIVLNTLGKHGRVDEALEIFNEMKQNGHHPDTYTYSALMSVYAAAKNKDQVIYYFDQLTNHPSYKPSAPIFTVILKYFASEGDVVNLKKYHDMMAQQLGFIDSFAFGTMLQGFSKAGDIQGLTEYYRFVKKEPFMVSCFNVTTMKMLMEILAQHDMKTFTEFWEQEATDNPLLHRAALHLLIKRSENFHQALKYFEEFEKIGVVPTRETYNQLLSMASKQDDEEIVKKIKNKMDKNGIQGDSYTYNAIISFYVAKKDITKCLACFDEMKQYHIEPNNVTYNKIMELLHKQNKHEEVLQFWNDMQQRNVQPDMLSYNLVLPALRALGDLTKIQQVVQQIQYQKIRPTPDVMMTLLDAYAIHGTIEQMLARYQEMEAAGITLARTMYHPIMYRFSREGNIDAMISYLELMMHAPGSEAGHPTVFQHFLRDQTIQHINRFYTTWKHLGLTWESWMWEASIQKLMSLRDTWKKEHCQSFCKIVATELHGAGGADMEALVASLLNSTASQKEGAKLTHLQGVQFYHLLLAVQATILPEESPNQNDTS